MNIYDIECGTCGGRTFKYDNGEYRCQGCGRALTDDEIERLLAQAHDDYVAEQAAEEMSKGMTSAEINEVMTKLVGANWKDVDLDSLPEHEKRRLIEKAYDLGIKESTSPHHKN